MSYTGAWAESVALILRLHGDGRSREEIAGLVPLARVPWDWRPAGISPAMVGYILEREGIRDLPGIVRPASARRLAFIEDFRGRWERWELDRPVGVDWFEERMRALYLIAGWIAGEIEVRKAKGEVG